MVIHINSLNFYNYSAYAALALRNIFHGENLDATNYTQFELFLIIFMTTQCIVNLIKTQ